MHEKAWIKVKENNEMWGKITKAVQMMCWQQKILQINGNAFIPSYLPNVSRKKKNSLNHVS